MNFYFLSFLLLYSQFTFGQVNVNASQIDSCLLENNQLFRQGQTNHIYISETIKAIDKNLNEVIKSKFNFKPTTYTIIESVPILIRQLTNRQEAIKIILSDKEAFANYQSWWEQYEHDTVKFLSNSIIQSEYDLNYPDFNYPKYLFTYPADSLYLTATENLIFYSKPLENKLEAVIKKTPLRQRKRLFNYLETNYDHFSKEDKEFKAKAIAIRTITLGSNNIIYAGVDIYGSHYLFTFDRGDSWKLKSTVMLWIY